MSSPAQFRSRDLVPAASRTAVLHLSGNRRGCADARDFTHRTLDDWSLEGCRDDALTVVTELAANAVLHGLPDRPTGRSAVQLRLSLRRSHLVCAVTDPSDHLPVYPHPADTLLEHGRGLHIVEALSAHWGWTRQAPQGKTVWAMLPADASG